METFQSERSIEKSETLFKQSLKNSYNSTNRFIDKLSANSKILEILSEYSNYKTESYYRNAFVIVLYSLIVIISLFVNSLVCLVLIKNKKLRTKANLLMANISVSGILMTVFNIPFNVIRIVLDDWPFGIILCKLLPSMQVTCV
jgi:hypothetical protein